MLLLTPHHPCGPQGIALSANPNYKVLGAAYPWIARRLLLDTAPELQETLRTLLYKVGPAGCAWSESRRCMTSKDVH